MSEIAEFTRHLGHYLPPPDVALVERAFAFSEHAHQGQFRKSGDPYISHPLAVASIAYLLAIREFSQTPRFA